MIYSRCFTFGLILIVFTISCKSKTDENQKDLQNARPNILFCIADDASMKSFGAYGDTFINTPNIDSLGSNGLVFNNAYNCNPKCAPARACLVTGIYSWQLKEAVNHWPKFPKEFEFYPHILMDNGYHVGFTGKGWGPGDYFSKHNPAGPEYNMLKLKPPFKGISNIDYVGNFELFLEENNQAKKPFCFWLGVKEPHRFYEKDSYKKVNKLLKEVDVPPFYPDKDIIKGDILDYSVEVEWFDTQVGKAIASLDERGMLENTLVIITSDHGMPFPRIKGQIYEEGFHVPFIVYWKDKISSGRSVEDFINFPDVAPTIMEIAGFRPHNQMTGKSFKDILLSEASGVVDKTRDHVLLGKERHDLGRANDDGINLGYPVRAIRNKKYLYAYNYKSERWPVGNPRYGLRNCDGSPTKDYIISLKYDKDDNLFYDLNFGKRNTEELYDIMKDPDCMNNLALVPEFKAICDSLKDQMESELIAQGDPRMFGKGDVFDSYQYCGPGYDYVNKKRLPKPLK